MTIKNNDETKKLQNFMLNTDFEKAMDNLSKDAVFKETVERRTDKFISRYGRAFSTSKVEGGRNLAEIENMRAYLCRLIDISEDHASKLSELSQLPISNWHEVAERAPVSAMGVTEWRSFQLPLEFYFREVISFPEDMAKWWSGATLSFQRRSNGLRLLLQSAPDGFALAISVGTHRKITLNKSHSAETIPCEADEIYQLRIGLAPFWATTL